MYHPLLTEIFDTAEQSAVANSDQSSGELICAGSAGGEVALTLVPVKALAIALEAGAARDETMDNPILYFSYSFLAARQPCDLSV